LENEKKIILLVCGLGRSGTSLLQSMLNAHERIHFMPEVRFLRTYAVSWRRRRRWRRAGNKGLIDELNNDQTFLRIKNKEAVLSCLRIRCAVHDSIWRVYQQLATCITNENAEVFGEKDPKIMEDIGLIKAALPEARIICMIRDPRAILASRIKAAWASGMPWWLQLMWIREQERNVRKFRGHDSEGSPLFVRYEDLVENPQKELAAISGAVGLKYSPSMLDFQESAKSLIDRSELQWKANTLRPLQLGNTMRWSRSLRPSQVTMTELVCASWMRCWNYENQSTMRGTRLVCLAVLARVLIMISPILYQSRKLWEQIR